MMILNKFSQTTTRILMKCFSLQSNLLPINSKYAFTSSANPTQISLLLEVEAKIEQVIKTSKPALNKLERSAKFQQIGFDSLDTVELIVRMQDYFGEELTNEEARSLESVGDCIDIFFNKLNAKVTNKIIMRDTEDFMIK